MATPNVRAFCLLTSTMLAALEAGFGERMQTWAEQWGLAQASTKVTVLPCDQTSLELVRASAWRQSWRAAEHSLHLAWPSLCLQALEHAMFAPDNGNAASQRPQLAPMVAQQALDDLLNHIVGHFLPNAPQRDVHSIVPEQEVRAGSGAAMIRLQIGEHALLCCINAPLVQAFAPRHAARQKLPPLPKIKLLEVLQHVPIRLRVEVGQAQVAFGNLLTVGKGDVIKLNSVLDQPVAITAPNGERFCEAYIGKMQSSIAVELVAIQS